MLPHEIPFDISAFPHRFIGSMIPDRNHYLESGIPASFRLYPSVPGFMPSILSFENGKWHARGAMENVAEAFGNFVTAWYE